MPQKADRLSPVMFRNRPDALRVARILERMLTRQGVNFESTVNQDNTQVIFKFDDMDQRQQVFDLFDNKGVELLVGNVAIPSLSAKLNLKTDMVEIEKFDPEVLELFVPTVEEVVFEEASAKRLALVIPKPKKTESKKILVKDIKARGIEVRRLVKETCFEHGIRISPLSHDPGEGKFRIAGDSKEVERAHVVLQEIGQKRGFAIIRSIQHLGGVDQVSRIFRFLPI